MAATGMGFSCVVVIPFVCLMGLFWLWVRVLRKPKHYHSVCGHCRYIVEGLQTMLCPECGSDFHKVGIETPAKRGHVEPGFFLAVWTILLLPVALLIGGVVASLGPETVTASTSFGVLPKSGSFGEVTIRAKCSYSQSGVSSGVGLTGQGSSTAGSRCTITFPRLTPKGLPDSLDLTVSTSSGPASSSPDPRLWVYPESGGYRYVRPAGEVVHGQKGFDKAVVEDWLATSGLGPNSPDLRADSAELFGLVNAYATGQASFTTSRYGLSGGSSSSTSSSPHGWFAGAVVIFWMVIYIGGILLYRRIHLRRSIEEAVATA